MLGCYACLSEKRNYFKMLDSGKKYKSQNAIF